MASIYFTFHFLKLHFFLPSPVESIGVQDFHLKDCARFNHVGPFSMWVAPLHAGFSDSPVQSSPLLNTNCLRSAASVSKHNYCQPFERAQRSLS